MRIKKFQLGGHDISVKYVKTVHCPSQGELFGRADPKNNVIEISTHLNGAPLSEDVITHTLFHELSHMMMILMNEFELNANEKFIDVLGMLLHQFHKTKR